MRIPIWLTTLAALAGLALVLLAGQLIINPDRPLILRAGFDLDTISPNADGLDDVTTFRYELSAPALVSIALEAEDGTRYLFRDRQRREPRAYSVLFSGVVDGYLLPGEEILGTVERRLLPDGMYNWQIIAEVVDEDTGETLGEEVQSGTLTIRDADAPLPLITLFSVGPDVFSPNQDGIDDRVEIAVYLEKEADLQVFLLGEDGRQIPISARKEGRLPGEAGRHVFDYEGGIDLGADPPPDGTYTVVALAQDAEGQRVRAEATLTIVDGGKPRAEVVPQAVGVDVVFDVWPYDEAYFATAEEPGQLIPLPDNPASLALTSIVLPLGDMLVFRLTIENYSHVPIRTSGPPPGTVYEQEQLAATLGWYEEAGAWRIGLQCETSPVSFPWRWAIGSDDELVTVVDPRNGNEYRYLPPGQRAVVWGAVRMTDLVETYNPQDCWAALIHERVEISERNNNVGRRSVGLAEPAGAAGR